MKKLTAKILYCLIPIVFVLLVGYEISKDWVIVFKSIGIGILLLVGLLFWMWLYIYGFGDDK